MPYTPQAIDILRKAKVLIAPAKAANDGGVRNFFFDPLLPYNIGIFIAHFSKLTNDLVPFQNMSAFTMLALIYNMH